jgi:hypothetical protein
VADSLGFFGVEITAFVSRAVSALYPADGLRPKLDRRETQPRVRRVLNSAIYSPGRIAFRGAERRASHPLWASKRRGKMLRQRERR